MNPIVTPEQEAAIRDMWGRMVPVREIARSVRISRNRMPRIVAAMGLEPRGIKRADKREDILKKHKAGLGYRQIALETGVSEWAVKKIVRGVQVDGAPAKRINWTDKEVAALIAGWDSALPPGENARRASAAIGRTLYSVMMRAKVAGLLATTLVDPSQPTPECTDKHAAACLREGGFPSFVEAPGAGFLFRDGRAVWAWPTDRMAA